MRALGHVGRILIASYPNQWHNRLEALQFTDWNKTNPLWHNGIVVNNSVQLSHATQALMIKILSEILL